MRIAMISEHASPLAAVGGTDAGGQNIYVANVARCLARQGDTVDIFTRWDDPSVAFMVPLGPGCRIVHVEAGARAPVPKEQLLAFMPAFASFCEAWMRRSERYDVIHANFFMSGWVGARLKEVFGTPLVTTFHALGKVRLEHQRESDGFPSERLAIEQSLMAQSDRIIAECPQDVADLERLYAADRARMSMIPCGFDAAEFKPVSRASARRRLQVEDTEFTVLQLGRMVPRKGIDTVIRAMACLTPSDARLRIVGGDCDQANADRTPEIGRLAQVARECGVSDRVVFEGRKRRCELRDWYAAADVFVTTPWYEPFGITPLEAMACARPVIGSRVGGLSYSIDDGVTGLLVPAKDHVALASALERLRANPSLAAAMGNAGLARVRRHFTWDRIAGQLSTVFQEVAARRACRAPTIGLAAPRKSRAVRGRSPALHLERDGAVLEDGNTLIQHAAILSPEAAR